jgi:hypothetical protein
MSIFKDRFPKECPPPPPVARECREEERGEASYSLTCLLLQITERYSLKRAEKYMTLNAAYSFYESLYVNGEARRTKDACTKLKGIGHILTTVRCQSTQTPSI